MLTGTDTDSHNTIDIQYVIDVYLLSTTLANSSLPQKMNVLQANCRRTLTAAVIVTVYDMDSVM